MSQNDLRHELAQLRSELDRLPEDSPGRERLLSLMGRIEAHLESEEGAVPHEPLVDGVSAAITEFEVEHPRTAGILRRIVHALSSMGI